MPELLEDIIRQRVKPTPFSGNWMKFLGNLPLEKQWNGTIFGPSFHGKSTFALYFAMQLTQFGNVYYLNAEEDTGKATLQPKLQRNGIRSLKHDFYFADSINMDEIHRELSSGKYKYCVRDSIHGLAKWNKLKPLDVWMDFRKYPEISFADVLFSTKDELTYKGESDMIHLAEFAIECKKNDADLPIAHMERKNRYKPDPGKFQHFDFIHNKIIRTNHE